MQWLALVVVCTALIALSYYSPKIGFSLLGALAAILITLYYLNLDESEIAEFPVPRESVVLSETHATESYGDSWNYSGRISNSSDKSVTDVQIKIILHDCPEGTQQITDACVVIGEDVDFVAINVPPRQARDFRDNISFRNADPKGIQLWSFELVSLRVTE